MDFPRFFLPLVRLRSFLLFFFLMLECELWLSALFDHEGQNGAILTMITKKKKKEIVHINMPYCFIYSLKSICKRNFNHNHWTKSVSFDEYPFIFATSNFFFSLSLSHLDRMKYAKFLISSWAWSKNQHLSQQFI